MVNYINYKTTSMGYNAMSPFIHKWLSYKHENELRAIFWSEAGNNKGLSNLKEGGYLLKINLKKLTDNIYISPTTPECQFQLIEEIARKELQIQVKPSELKDDPLY